MIDWSSEYLVSVAGGSGVLKQSNLRALLLNT